MSAYLVRRLLQSFIVLFGVTLLSFLAIGGAICGEDFATGGRTLATLGLGQLDQAELQKLLREGFDQ